MFYLFFVLYPTASLCLQVLFECKDIYFLEYIARQGTNFLKIFCKISIHSHYKALITHEICLRGTTKQYPAPVRQEQDSKSGMQAINNARSGRSRRRTTERCGRREISLPRNGQIPYQN